MLLGKDDVIRDVCPAYETDALLRKVNIDRYDDREVVRTNLIESYEQLMAFARKHLPDHFYLENDIRISLRDLLARELISNTIIHREFTSAYIAKFIIENNRILVENANRASWTGLITPKNLEPNPKNPIIASFFRTIGRADRLGSGIRNVFKYASLYGGGQPKFEKQDIFRITLSFDSLTKENIANNNPTDRLQNPTNNPTNEEDNPTNNPTNKVTNELDRQILNHIKENPRISYSELAAKTGKNRDTIATHIKTLAKDKIIARKGNKRGGFWEFIDM